MESRRQSPRKEFSKIDTLQEKSHPLMVRIRLRRTGAKNNPAYRIVVADQRAPRDGAFIETIGHYLPTRQPHVVEINEAKAREWLGKGAQPSETAAGLLRQKGILDSSNKITPEGTPAPEPKAPAPKKAAPVAEVPTQAPAEAAPVAADAPVADAPVADAPVADAPVAEGFVDPAPNPEHEMPAPDSPVATPAAPDAEKVMPDVESAEPAPVGDTPAA